MADQKLILIVDDDYELSDGIRAILEALADGLFEDPATMQRYLHTASKTCWPSRI